jgi:hypothetical protein
MLGCEVAAAPHRPEGLMKDSVRRWLGACLDKLRACMEYCRQGNSRNVSNGASSRGLRSKGLGLDDSEVSCCQKKKKR